MRKADFRYTLGAASEFASSAPVRRSFCARCGTPMTYWHRDSPDTIDITISTLDAAGTIAPTDHIWMQGAVEWDRPTDGLPRYRTTRVANIPFT